MRAQNVRGIILILLSALAAVCLLTVITARSRVSGITVDDRESDSFRAQCFTEEIIEQMQEVPSGDLLRAVTTTMLMGHYHPSQLASDNRLLLCYKEREYQQMYQTYQAIWQDVELFPVAADGEITYEDTWLAVREYGGRRFHEGCDLFGPDNVSGVYPVVSMTDGTVENAGWLPLGGYRLGIRAGSGGYYYYAHLSGYSRNYTKGDKITAGDILGYMGDTGYGVEKTTGRFPVHLHLGIYIQTTNYPELSVNPYWILRYIEKNRIKYSY